MFQLAVGSFATSIAVAPRDVRGVQGRPRGRRDPEPRDAPEALRAQGDQAGVVLGLAQGARPEAGAAGGGRLLLHW